MKTRTIIPKIEAFAETPCLGCEKYNLKIERVIVNSFKGSKRRLSIQMLCRCTSCHYKQLVQMVEMP